MLDPVKVVADRIVYWAQINNPDAGAAEFSTYWSTLKAQDYRDVKYGDSYPTSVNPKAIETAEFVNGSSVADKQTFTVNKTTTDTFSWSLKEGVSTKLSGKAGLPFVAEGQAEVSATFESTQTWTKTETRSWTYSSEVNVPAMKKIRTSFVVAESIYRVPFTAKVPVRGNAWIWFAKSGWWGVTIDGLISELKWDANTFECVIEGIFNGVYGSHYQVKVEEFDLPKTTASPSAEVPTSTRIIDSGVIFNGNLQSNFAAMTNFSAKGPEQ